MIRPNVYVEEDSTSLESLSAYLDRVCDDDQLRECLVAAAEACAEVAHEVARLPLMAAMSQRREQGAGKTPSNSMDIRGEEQKTMDVVANAIFCKHLLPVAAALASEEEDQVLGQERDESMDRKNFEVAFDPLDGSSNLDCSIPTGSIFGISQHLVPKKRIRMVVTTTTRKCRLIYLLKVEGV
jgi:fructose-1,6-bisphosphatase